MIDTRMDVLRELSSSDLDKRRKTLHIVPDLITTETVDGVILILKKELVKTQSLELEKDEEYRHMLIKAIHSCVKRFPKVASTVLHLLMDFLGDSNVASAMEVVVFVQEMMQTDTRIRVSIVAWLLYSFHQIRAARVCSCALWIIGEYCSSLSEVESGIATIKECLGELPFYSASEEGEAIDSSKKNQQASSNVAQVTENLRSLLLSGDFLLGAIVVWTLTKLVLRLEELQASKAEVNKAATSALLIIVSMLQFGQSSVHPIDQDSYDKIVLCIRLLCNTGDDIRKFWLNSCHEGFVKMLSDKQLRETADIKAKAQISHSLPDDLGKDEVQDDLKGATGEFIKDEDDANKLNHVIQLTGLSDMVYAQAHVTVLHSDIVLDVTVVNRTKQTLENLSLELATMGDLKLVERPQNYTLAPESSKQIKANIEVSSTETGVIFGNSKQTKENIKVLSTETGVIFGDIVYETSDGASDGPKCTVVALNHIHIDIMDYISPPVCSDATFRSMWAEFEWEDEVKLGTKAWVSTPYMNMLKKRKIKWGTTGQDEVQTEMNMSKNRKIMLGTTHQDEAQTEWVSTPYMNMSKKRKINPGRTCQNEAETKWVLTPFMDMSKKQKINSGTMDPDEAEIDPKKRKVLGD